MQLNIGVLACSFDQKCHSIQVPTFTKVKLNFENHSKDITAFWIHINVAYSGTAKLISVHVPDFLFKGEVSRFYI